MANVEIVLLADGDAVDIILIDGYAFAYDVPSTDEALDIVRAEVGSDCEITLTDPDGSFREVITT